LLHRIQRLFSIYAAYHLPEESRHPRWGRLRLMWPFAWVGLRALPAAWRWARHRDPAARARVKQLLDLSGPAPLALDPDVLCRGTPMVIPAGAVVTVVMPVYGNLPLVRAALEAVVAHTEVSWRMVLVDDASPDTETLPFLRCFAEAHPVTLIENAENLGFVGAVNRGLDAARAWPDPVVLLNTDALVPEGWAPRLLRPLWEDTAVGSVTPLSNDAELGSVPEPGRASAVTAAEAEVIDQVAQGLNGALRVAAPAGVGFCMALAPQALARVPRFDPIFAPGYGEEVDWCQATRALGFSHVYVPGLFVAHIGGQSFGSSQKQALLQRNTGVITRRYPRFDADVHGFLRRDPLVTARLALGLARAELRRSGPLPVYLAHSMGGGAEVDLQRRLRADLATVGAAFVIRVGGVFRFALELWSRRDDGSAGKIAAGTETWTDIQRLLAPVVARQLIYSCAVGDVDPVALPELFLGLRRHGDGLEVLMHDYFPLSPNPTLLEEGDRWEGVPDPHGASSRHRTRRPDGRVVELVAWRSVWGRFLASADVVTSFCETADGFVRTAYPDIETRVVPHTLPVAVPSLPRPRSGPVVLGLLGNLSPHKGAGVAQALSCSLSNDSDVRLVLLGDIDPAYQFVAPAVSHGRYAVADLPDLAARYGISCWLIPSLWPETFSFTTHEALASGLPVLVFDLGGQAEAVRVARDRGARAEVLPLVAAQDPRRIWMAARRLSSAV